MYNFFYNVMKPKYGENCRLLYTDADSLVLDVTTDDVYADFRAEGMRKYFDFSDYPKDHPNYDASNAKVLGLFKDERSSSLLTEFVGLKAKMYAMRVGDKEKMCAKGCPKGTVKKYTKFDLYKDVLFDDKTTQVSFKCLRSENHQLHTMSLTKMGLSNYDNKRYYLDSVVSLPYGQKSLEQ